MRNPDDPLTRITRPDRLHYATGELLGADDFVAEQTYHRRQLARALLHLQGSGTVAGLRVVANHQPGADVSLHEVELQVAPGLAIDRAGRLIEVPREACLRLRRWFEFGAGQPPEREGLNIGDLRGAWREDASVDAGGVVVADVFLAFHPCDRGYTPAFANGPFDALDASQPSHVRDGYELVLVPRPEPDEELRSAFDPWSEVTGATVADRLESARTLSINLWRALASLPANPPGVDPYAALLARLRLPAAPAPNVTSAPVPDWTADTWPDDSSSHLDNNVRNFLLPPAAIARIVGA